MLVYFCMFFLAVWVIITTFALTLDFFIVKV